MEVPVCFQPPTGELAPLEPSDKTCREDLRSMRPGIKAEMLLQLMRQKPRYRCRIGPICYQAHQQRCHAVVLVWVVFRVVDADRVPFVEQ